jgi:hypothetical protein
MSNRVKYTLAAPYDVTESVIEGTYYWPEDAGDGTYVVTTTNELHRDLLVRHGYTPKGEVSILPPAKAHGAIETDELGRGQLAAALTERGVSYPLDATRGELAEIADAWNGARRRGRLAHTPEKTAAEAPQAPAAVHAPAAQVKPAGEPEKGQGGGVEGEVDFGEASYDELKGWLAAHGVSFPPNTKKVDLRAMAEQAHAALKTPKTSAAA